MGELITEKPHEPRLLKNKKHMTIKKKVCEGVRRGLPVRKAFRKAGVNVNTYDRWLRWAKEDLEKGFTGTALIDLMLAVAQEEDELHARIMERGIDVAMDGNVKMITYLLDNRFGYVKQRKNAGVVDTDDKGDININIVNMTGVETDNNDDVVEIEVNGECRDDSDPTEMD